MLNPADSISGHGWAPSFSFDWEWLSMASRDPTTEARGEFGEKNPILNILTSIQIYIYLRKTLLL